MVFKTHQEQRNQTFFFGGGGGDQNGFPPKEKPNVYHETAKRPGDTRNVCHRIAMEPELRSWPTPQRELVVPSQTSRTSFIWRTMPILSKSSPRISWAFVAGDFVSANSIHRRAQIGTQARAPVRQSPPGPRQASPVDLQGRAGTLFGHPSGFVRRPT